MNIILNVLCGERIGENFTQRITVVFSTDITEEKIIGPKSDEVKAEWRKTHEELNDLYCSPNIVWVNKSRVMR
jgi:hypothetical protein